MTDNRLVAQGAASGLTTYGYDPVGNLAGYTYPNGVQTSYSYDTLNRLQVMGATKSAPLSSYTYTLGAAGNRNSVAELSGRTVEYGYDSLYRLNSETVTVDPVNHNGQTTYTYDPVGNRQVLKINGVTVNTYNYDANDRLTSDVYDNDGNTVSSTGITNGYDFENHLIQHGAVAIVYDGDGNRVGETVGSVTTKYLVDTQNPTGYAQVVDEVQDGAVTRTYTYGLERVNENQLAAGNWQPSFYGYDGHGSVRQLFSAAGVVTDTYDYDAFGNLVASTGSTPNNCLFAGEQFEPALGLYYNRARYLSSTVGRFWGMDTLEGDPPDPSSLHKYIYTQDEPVDNLDSSGNEVDELGFFALAGTLTSLPQLNFQGVLAGVKKAIRDDPNDLWLEPTLDHQVVPKHSFWAGQNPPERSIQYELKRKDGTPLKNPAYNWTISEHQTLAWLASGPNGTSQPGPGKPFCDDISPLLGHKNISSDQTFTISPTAGDYNARNENDDVFVHTQDGDFRTLRIFLGVDAISINGRTKWSGTADAVCE